MKSGEIIEYKGVQIEALHPKDPGCNGCMFNEEGTCVVVFNNSIQCWDSKGRGLIYKEIKK